MRPLVLLLQEPYAGPDPIWWVWLLVAAGFLGIIIYLVGRIGPGGPWARR